MRPFSFPWQLFSICIALFLNWTKFGGVGRDVVVHRSRSKLLNVVQSTQLTNTLDQTINLAVDMSKNTLSMAKDIMENTQGMLANMAESIPRMLGGRGRRSPQSQTVF